MQITIPFLSQYADSIPSEWQPRACGVTALAMALGYTTKQLPQVSDLITEGLAAEAYLPHIGWKHAGLVALSNAHGALRSYRKEFRKLKLPKLLVSWYVRWYLLHALNQGFVPIVSIRFDGMQDSHLVPITGVGRVGVWYNDSAKHHETDGVNVYMAWHDFHRQFRKLAIFIG